MPGLEPTHAETTNAGEHPHSKAARSGAECQSDCGRTGVGRSSVSADQTGGVGQAVPPSFLVQDIANVNSQLHRAAGLLAMWDFLEHKGRVGKTHVILSRKDDPAIVRIMPAKARSRYFEDGRLHMSRRIQRRLGKFEKVPGLMLTLTYDPKRIGKREAWASFGKDTRRFINAVNQYRRRRGWRRLHYLWVVEVQKGTGYPHVHVFFPKLKWIAPLDVINNNWRHGRSNVESPRKIMANCAAYISKYLRKLSGWTDLHLALLWCGKSRMYCFSRGFSAAIEKRETEWRRWQVVQADDVALLERNLMDGGSVIDVLEKRKTAPSE